MTWIGHATLYLRLGGLYILTDPQFSEYASPVPFAGPRRVVPPVPVLDALPRIDADEAVRIHLDVKAKRSVGIHWGTFYALSDEDMDEPPKKRAEARARLGVAEGAFFVVRHGETRRIGP